MATHSSTLAWKIPRTEESGRLQSMGWLRVRHDWATSLSLSCIGEGWQPNPSCLENPRDGEPVGLPSMGSHRVRHDWSDSAAAARDEYNPNNHDGVITHLQPDILECEVKWALESITMNKASGGDRIPIQLYQILKDDAVKVLHSI